MVLTLPVALIGSVFALLTFVVPNAWAQALGYALVQGLGSLGGVVPLYPDPSTPVGFLSNGMPNFYHDIGIMTILGVLLSLIALKYGLKIISSIISAIPSMHFKIPGVK